MSRVLHAFICAVSCFFLPMKVSSIEATQDGLEAGCLTIELLPTSLTVLCNARPVRTTTSEELLEVAQSNGEKAFNRYENFDLTADAMLHFPVSAQGQCERRCTQEERCVAYTFDEWNRVCFLKGAVGALLLNARSISGVLSNLEQPVRSSEPIIIEKFNKKSFIDTGFYEVRASSFEGCSALCLADDFCSVFTFMAKGSQCRLYERSGEYFDRKGSTSGAKRQ